MCPMPSHLIIGFLGAWGFEFDGWFPRNTRTMVEGPVDSWGWNESEIKRFIAKKGPLEVRDHLFLWRIVTIICCLTISIHHLVSTTHLRLQIKGFAILKAVLIITCGGAQKNSNEQIAMKFSTNEAANGDKQTRFLMYLWQTLVA